MPALDNPKHERFAQLLAKGKTQAEAYVEAGYAHSEQNACRLTSSDKVQARVAEIQERAAIRTEVTLASITSNLARIAQSAELLGESSGLSVARAAHMDIAKLHGLVIEKTKGELAVTSMADIDDAALTAIALAGRNGTSGSPESTH